MPHLAIVGAGATGTRVARQVAHYTPDCRITLVDDGEGVAHNAARALGNGVQSATSTQLPQDVDIIVVATRAGTHAEIVQQNLGAAPVVISVADSIADVRALLDIDEQAKSEGCKVVIGVGMMPGLSDVLALHGTRWFDTVREIHVSKFGTGGPDCARQHHRALSSMCFDWRNEQWNRRPGGSGRELSWFPAPVQAADCYRAALGDPLLLIRVHPDVERITARMAATRRDRLTMNFPMLRKPHPEGLLGAVRVELRGVKNGQQVELVLGCAESPAVAAGAVAATAVSVFLDNNEHETFGARGLAEFVDPTSFLHGVRERGLRPEIFIGADETY